MQHRIPTLSGAHVFSLATRRSIARYRASGLGKKLCGQKPFGSRHWEYPWAVEQSGILEKKGLRILDVAPDFSFPYADYLCELGHTVSFIDMGRRQWSDTIEWGFEKNRSEKNLAVMDVRRMAFPSRHFDCIFCISVLEHIVCPTQDPDHPRLKDIFDPLGARPALAEMRRCLKPGGLLLLSVDLYGGPKWKPHFEQWDIFADLAATGFGIDPPPDFNRQELFTDPETYVSQFFGPYMTLGFKLGKEHSPEAL